MLVYGWIQPQSERAFVRRIQVTSETIETVALRTGAPSGNGWVSGQEPRLGYHRKTLLRFLFLAFPTLAILLAMFQLGLDRLGLEGPVDLPTRLLLGRLVLEAAGLIALFLMMRGGQVNRWFAGLAAGWVGWIFRGPVLMLTVAGSGRLAPSSWWNLVLAWLVLYTLCGLVLAALGGFGDKPKPVAGFGDTP